MLRNYLLIAWRNLLKHKAFSVINVLGLSIGMAACLLIVQYVRFELSYDAFHEKSDRIYRIRLDSYKDGRLTTRSIGTYADEGPAIQAECPEVEGFVRLHGAGGLYTYGRKSGELVQFHEENAYYTEPSFLQMFTFPVVRGEGAAALGGWNALLLSESAARKYFGTENPVGKVLQLHSGWAPGSYTVKGVFKDVPPNSHLQFDFLLSFRNILAVPQFKDRGWEWWNFANYLLLRPGTDLVALESKFPRILDKYLPPELRVPSNREELRLEPLRSVYLHPLADSKEKSGNATVVYILLVTAVLILGIAYVNYINLSTARSLERAREVGIRKAMGSSRRALVVQFLLESALLYSAATVIALTLVQALLPLFRQLAGSHIPLDVLRQPGFWGAFVSLFVAGVFLSGLYPALLLSGYNPVLVLKGSFGRGRQGHWLRQGLVVFQFAISVFLLVATVTVYRQLTFMRDRDLGVRIAQKVTIKAPFVIDREQYWDKLLVFKNRLRQEAFVKNISVSSSVPGENSLGTDEFRRQTDAYKQIYNVVAIDQQFVPLFGLALRAGRNFSDDFTTDQKAILVNESAARLLGFDRPEAAVGQQVVHSRGTYPIVGVLKDYNHQYAKKPVPPTVYFYSPNVRRYYTLDIAAGTPSPMLTRIGEAYQEAFPGNPFEYFFLDDYYNAQYRVDQQFGLVFALFAGQAIFIACLGLFGLSLFTTTQRTKEIGIRKVLGATVRQVLVLLSKDFIRLVVLASLVAWPVAYWSVHKWLEGYASRIQVNAWLFVLPTLLVLLIAWLTIGFQTWKAARANPVDSLRYE